MTHTFQVNDAAVQGLFTIYLPLKISSIFPTRDSLDACIQFFLHCCQHSKYITTY